MNQTRLIQLIEPFKTIPNQLTGIRFLLSPILWIFAMTGEPFYVGIGLIVAFASDALDGHLARKLGLVSEFGAKFDSLTDLLLTGSAVAWFFMLRPQVFAENALILVIAIVIYAAALSVGWIRFGPLAQLDLYWSKLAAGTEYIFIIHAFLFGRYNQILLSIAIGLSILSCTETLVLRLIQPRGNEPVRSVAYIFLAKNRTH
jgi:CDP-diacylglycerol---glycerol-3-phosphate 3-phosphatidyltransferase